MLKIRYPDTSDVIAISIKQYTLTNTLYVMYNDTNRYIIFLNNDYNRRYSTKYKISQVKYKSVDLRQNEENLKLKFYRICLEIFMQT